MSNKLNRATEAIYTLAGIVVGGILLVMLLVKAVGGG